MLPKCIRRSAGAVAAVALLLASAAAAQASTVTYSGDSTTVILTGGDDGAHDITFRQSADHSDEMIDTAGFTSIEFDCTVVSSPTWIKCPGHARVQVDLGAGNDKVNFSGNQFDCFDAYAIDLGDGQNTTNLSGACGSAVTTATVNSGSGPDVLTAGSQRVTFDAGAGGDGLFGSPGPDTLHGGDGPDRLFGNGDSDELLGEDGADSLKGAEGNDLLDGGPGDDGLERCSDCISAADDPGVGADDYRGGEGTDKLWLDAYAPGVAVSMNGAADDGAAGEGDNVASDVEEIEGTAGADSFTGSAAADGFSGLSGNDVIHGGDGPDALEGGGGDDQVFGDGGNDRAEGAEDNDTVDGGAGTDELFGDIAGGCTAFCEFDADTLLARDGERDTVDCGGGPDAAQVDELDLVTFCSVVDRAAAAGTGPAGSGPGAGAGPAGGSGAGAGPGGSPAIQTTGKLSRAKGIGVNVTCTGPCSFTVKLAIAAKLARKVGLGRKVVAIGTARGKLTAAGTKTVTVKVTPKARKKLRRLKKVAATLKVAVTDAGGSVANLKRSVSLKP